ncbi:Clp protease N-terminal domain-containing protein [Streptomyces sp. NPDC057877]|uniref:Clp protease N-terminal domain-containing protein n=1 Tax=Streptomyces sp. NPDC057877 TaxID=3346269 RepID=UPI0036B2C962
MQHRIPPQAPADQGAHRSDNDARLTDELAAVVAGARRRAQRDGDRHVDSAHLLHSLLEYDPEVRAVFDDGPQLARLLGYLVQRSIGYGLRWQGAVEDSGALPVVAGGREVEGCSPLVAQAMERAWARAVGRDQRAGCVDLLAEIVADPAARAVEVLGRAGVDVGGLRAAIEGGRSLRPLGPSGR